MPNCNILSLYYYFAAIVRHRPTAGAGVTIGDNPRLSYTAQEMKHPTILHTAAIFGYNRKQIMFSAFTLSIIHGVLVYC